TNPWAGGAGTSFERAVSVATAADGTVFVAGAFVDSGTFDLDGPSETTLTPTGSAGGFLRHHNPPGPPLWAKSIHGDGYDVAFAVAATVDGGVVLTGRFDGSTVTAGEGEANQTTLTSGGGAFDLWIARYQADGSLAWAKRAGGASVDDRAVG